MIFYTPQHSGHYSAATHMFRAPKIDFAMVNITYPVVDGDGVTVRVKTWAIGTTVKRALSGWLRARPDVDPKAIEHSVVTESHWNKPPRVDPIGERVEIADPFLHSLG